MDKKGHSTSQLTSFPYSSTMTMVDSQTHPSQFSALQWNPSTISSLNGFPSDLNTFDPTSSKWSSLNSTPLNPSVSLNLNLNSTFLSRNPPSNGNSPQWTQFQTLQRAVGGTPNFMNTHPMLSSQTSQQQPSQPQQQQHPQQAYPTPQQTPGHDHRPPQNNRISLPQASSYPNPAASNQFFPDQMKDFRFPFDLSGVPQFPSIPQNLLQQPHIQEYLNSQLTQQSNNFNMNMASNPNVNHPSQNNNNPLGNNNSKESEQMLAAAAFEYAKRQQSQLWKSAVYASSTSSQPQFSQHLPQKFSQPPPPPISSSSRPYFPNSDSTPAFDMATTVSNMPRFDQLGLPNFNAMPSSFPPNMGATTSNLLSNYAPNLPRMHPGAMPSINPLGNPLFPQMPIFQQMPALQGISNLGSLTSFAQHSPMSNAIIADQLEEQMYPCTHTGCTQVLKSRFALKRHMKKHTGEKPHSCPFKGCHRKFSETTALKRHTRTHTGEKPYRCSFPSCTKTFADATNVKRHEMTHTGEKPFKCNFHGCGRCFSRRSSLRTHMTSLHNVRLEDMPPDQQELH